MLIDEDPIWQVKFVWLFKVTVLKFACDFDKARDQTDTFSS